jgi:predicted dehydrogenase
MDRRRFLAATAGLAATGAAASAGEGRKYRAAVIGHTGRGDYGHDLDKCWLDIPEAEIVAVADADPKGLEAAVARLKARKGYGDYRAMLDEAKPDFVSIAPRWLDQHRDMVVAACERGVRGIYLEKPMARTLAECDAMIAACEKAGTRLAIAHQTRYSPRLKVVADLIAAGRIGKVVEIRARGKEDGRGGGEDLWVLGTHVLDLVHYYGGAPKWCFGHVEQGGRPIRKEDVKEGAEGIGPLAGDSLHAMYGLEKGATGYFDSVRGTGHAVRFGITIYGSQGVIEMGTNYLPPVYLFPDASWSPGQSGKAWTAVSSAGVGVPEPIGNGTPHMGNVTALHDLIESVETNRQPLANMYTARTAVEMIVAVFESQRQGRPVAFPLENRENPLATLI